MENWFFESMRIFCMFVRSIFESVYCLYRFSKLSHLKVTIFGGKQTEQESVYAKHAYSLAGLCVEKGMSVLTGGGPGIMQAANCGAREQAKKSSPKMNVTLGIGVYGVDYGFVNPCADEVKLSQMFMRQWFLMRYSCGFIVMPGGIGTADELFEIINLIKLNTVRRVPIVLFGVDYWQPLVDWFELSGIAKGFIEPEYRKFFIVTDSHQEALGAITRKY